MKNIMITGASKGLGRALTLAFAKQGHTLAICARGEAELRIVKREAEELGAAKVIAIQADIANPNEVERFVSVVEEQIETIDVLINNASIFGPGPTLLADYGNQAFQEVLLVNAMNPFFMTKRVLPGMMSRNSGRIINITSEAGKTGFAEWGAYGVSKFALEGLTKIWMDELEGTNISMNLVDPGEMDTSMHDRAVPNCDYDLAKPEEVLDVFQFLVSDESNGVTGKRFEAQNFNREGSE
ncbi:SDR family oxidoreductase [Bacillus spongiae]|uniref:SDR family oxidoreductase n=1 Tax=Bacillus spongiae TaxID=2683610 RepID=A0ABU8HID4_9BACI